MKSKLLLFLMLVVLGNLNGFNMNGVLSQRVVEGETPLRQAAHASYNSSCTRPEAVWEQWCRDKDGRYLVTHNHFAPPLSTPGARYSAISLYRANGEILLSQAPITAFTVAAGDAETLRSRISWPTFAVGRRRRPAVKG